MCMTRVDTMKTLITLLSELMQLHKEEWVDLHFEPEGEVIAKEHRQDPLQRIFLVEHSISDVKVTVNTEAVS